MRSCLCREGAAGLIDDGQFFWRWRRSSRRHARGDEFGSLVSHAVAVFFGEQSIRGIDERRTIHLSDPIAYARPSPWHTLGLCGWHESICSVVGYPMGSGAYEG